MSLNTLAGLKAALPDYLDGRSADDIAERVDEFVAGAHHRIFFGTRDPNAPSNALRIRFMETSAPITVNAAAVALPADFLGARNIYLEASPVITPDLVSPQQLFKEFPMTSITDRPRVAAIEGTNIRFGPTPDAVYTGRLLYYALPALPTEADDTNWLMTNAPMVYLKAMQIEAWEWIGEPDLAQRAAISFAGMIDGLMMTDEMDKWAGPPTSRRLAGVLTP